MKTVSLSGSRRANVGKKDAAAIRKSGMIPCVIYGGKEQMQFTVNEIDLKKIVWSPDVYDVHLNIDGNQHHSIIQEIQFHPVNDKVVHIDFLEIFDNKPIKLKLPVKLNGTPEGVKKGGKLLSNFKKLTVKGLVKHLPEKIELNVEALNIGDGIRIRELKFEGISFLDNPSSYVASVQVTRNVEETAETTPAAGAAATPAAGVTPAAPAAKTPEKKK